MKKRNHVRKQSVSEIQLDAAALRAVTGGSKEAYFVRVDRETTTQVASSDDSTDSR